jgi:hypothetical protein
MSDIKKFQNFFNKLLNQDSEVYESEVNVWLIQIQEFLQEKKIIENRYKELYFRDAVAEGYDQIAIFGGVYSDINSLKSFIKANLETKTAYVFCGDIFDKNTKPSLNVLMLLLMLECTNPYPVVILYSSMRMMYINKPEQYEYGSLLQKYYPTAANTIIQALLKLPSEVKINMPISVDYYLQCTAKSRDVYPVKETNLKRVLVFPHKHGSLQLREKTYDPYKLDGREKYIQLRRKSPYVFMVSTNLLELLVKYYKAVIQTDDPIQPFIINMMIDNLTDFLLDKRKRKPIPKNMFYYLNGDIVQYQQIVICGGFYGKIDALKNILTKNRATPTAYIFCGNYFGKKPSLEILILMLLVECLSPYPVYILWGSVQEYDQVLKTYYGGIEKKLMTLIDGLPRYVEIKVESGDSSIGVRDLAVSAGLFADPRGSDKLLDINGFIDTVSTMNRQSNYIIVKSDKLLRKFGVATPNFKIGGGFSIDSRLKYISVIRGSKYNLINIQDTFPKINIEKETINNPFFRQVLLTEGSMQLVAMSLNPGGIIPKEMHTDSTQFFRPEKGSMNIGYGAVVSKSGVAIYEGDNTKIDEYGMRKVVLNENEVFIIANNTVHEVKTDKGVKLYTIYSPPQHSRFRIDETIKDSEFEPRKYITGYIDASDVDLNMINNFIGEFPDSSPEQMGREIMKTEKSQNIEKLQKSKVSNEVAQIQKGLTLKTYDVLKLGSLVQTLRTKLNLDTLLKSYDKKAVAITYKEFYKFLNSLVENQVDFLLSLGPGSIMIAKIAADIVGSITLTTVIPLVWNIIKLMMFLGKVAYSDIKIQIQAFVLLFRTQKSVWYSIAKVGNIVPKVRKITKGVSRVLKRTSIVDYRGVKDLTGRSIIFFNAFMDVLEKIYSKPISTQLIGSILKSIYDCLIALSPFMKF